MSQALKRQEEHNVPKKLQQVYTKVFQVSRLPNGFRCHLAQSRCSFEPIVDERLVYLVPRQASLSPSSISVYSKILVEQMMFRPKCTNGVIRYDKENSRIGRQMNQ